MELKRIQNIIHDNMMTYSQYTITNRALPDIRDGLKPVYRRILISMHNMRISNFTKSANVVGNVMKYHPHGNSYSTIVGMVQTDNNIIPLITGKGSFGQHTSRDLQAAADRYTEIKLSDLSKDIFRDVNNQMVDFVPNYDGTLMMPEVLPVQFPMVLTIAQEGIAVGMSNKMPSFNLKEVNDATEKYIKTGEHTVLIPDFATGGEIIKNTDAFNQINSTGNGTVRLRAKAEIIGNTISIKEIPYTTTREAIIEAIIKLIKNKKITEISNVQDLTGINGMEIEITAKRNTDMNMLLAKLYKWTPMENTFSANMNILINNLPRVVGTSKIIETWVKWRAKCIKKGIEHELVSLNETLHKLLGLEKILLDVDKAIEIIRTSKEEEIEENLKSYFNIDDLQAEYVSNIKLRKLNKDNIIKQISDIEDLKNDIKEKEDSLNDENKINEIIIKGLKEASKKYGEPRRTKIVDPENVIIEIPRTEVQQVENTVDNTEHRVLLTKDGYIKKVKVDATDIKIKDGDKILHDYKVNNQSEILVFVNTDAYKLYVNNIPEHSTSEFGLYIPTHIQVKASDIHGYGVINDEAKYILIEYDNSKVAKISISSYKTTGRRTKLENSIFVGAKVNRITTLFDDVNLELHWKGKVTNYNTSNMKVKSSRNTQGVTIRYEKLIIN